MSDATTLTENSANGSASSPASIPEPEPRQLLSTKIRARHYERLAIVYVRQSSPHQVLEHRESRARQYDLVNHAVALGWTRASAADRRRSGSERAQCRSTPGISAPAGRIDIGSRRHRSWSGDESPCSVVQGLAPFARTLRGVWCVLADQDGIYDPCDSNDRLLLGLKGTMSEFELFTMRNRLERGKLYKAERGELFIAAPPGYLKLPTGQVVLDPDEQARAVIQLIFDAFDEVGTVYGVMRHLVRRKFILGTRLQHGAQRGELAWRRPILATLFRILHHPIYAGAYAFGRQTTGSHKRPGEKRRMKIERPEDEWKVLLRDKMPAYITWERYLANQERLRQNRSRRIPSVRRGRATPCWRGF